MRIAVGSKNPVKINATKLAFTHYYDNIEVISFNAKSGVSDTPLSDDETMRGAINRVNDIFSSEFDYCVGLEGGAQNTKQGMFIFGWSAVLNKQKKLSLGSTGKILLPAFIAKKVISGEDLGPLMSTLTITKNLNKKEGAVGYLTKNMITRTQFLEHAILLSIARFINKIYDE